MKVAVLSIALLTSNLTYASTPIDGWYSNLFGGYAYVPNNIDKTYAGLTYSNAGYKAGYDAGASIGYKSNVMRYEGQVTYVNAPLKSFNLNNVPQTGVTGQNDVVLGFANVYYDFPNYLNCLQPYLGVGIGYSWVNAALKSTGPYGKSTYSGYNTPFSYQGSAGVTYNFAESYALNLGYRYVATVKANNLGKMYQAQLANLGVVYRFDGNNYK